MIRRFVRWLVGDPRCLFRLSDEERQGMMQATLIAGLMVETLLLVGAFLYNERFFANHGVRSQLASEALPLIVSLMKIQLGAVAAIALGDLVSIKIGEWFEMRRNGEAGG